MLGNKMKSNKMKSRCWCWLYWPVEKPEQWQ